MKVQTLREVAIEDRKIFIRADLDVPLERGRILDAFRLEALLPTLRYCLERGGRVVLAGHLGIPGGSVDPRLSLEPVGAWLAEQLDVEVLLTDEPVGDGARRVLQNAREGQLVLLENLRFHPGETAGDEGFARTLAEGVDLYVGDALAAAIRRDASVVVLPTLVQERAMGLRLQAELDALGRLTDRPARPFVALVGGTRLADKLPVLEGLLARADRILIGGEIAHTLIKAEGGEVGSSPVEANLLVQAGEWLRNARSRNVEVLLPSDHRVVALNDPEGGLTVVDTADGIPGGQKGVDIGPRTEALYAAHVTGAGTVLWYGPLGQVEVAACSTGTRVVGRAMADSHAFTVVSGSDTATALRAAGVASRIRHLSTGGLAALEFLRGRTLPGIAALES